MAGKKGAKAISTTPVVDGRPGRPDLTPEKQAAYDADEADVQRQLDEIAEREAGDIPAPDGDNVGNTMSRRRAEEHRDQ